MVATKLSSLYPFPPQRQAAQGQLPSDVVKEAALEKVQPPAEGNERGRPSGHEQGLDGETCPVAEWQKEPVPGVTV